MKRPLTQRLLWARAMWAEHRCDYDKALRLVERLELETSLRPSQQAFKAMLLVRNDNPTAAQPLFSTLRESLKDKEDFESQYIKRYAQSWLATIRCDPYQARYEDRKAAEIACDSSLKHLLWLPGDPPQDPLDAEFDAWLNANYPEDGGRDRIDRDDFASRKS